MGVLKAAMDSGFGKGVTTNTIVQNGNYFKNTVGGLKEFVQEFTVDGGLQRLESSEGVVMLTPVWCDNYTAIVTNGAQHNKTQVVTSSKRYLSNTNEMAVQVTTGDGIAVTSYFKKQSSSSGTTETVPEGATLEGSWIMHRYEGNLDQFFQDVGVGWMIRKAASAMDYGRGKAKQKITIDGNQMTVEETGGLKAIQYTWTIGAGWQTFTNQGGPARINPAWDANGVTISCQHENADRSRSWKSKRRFISRNEFMIVYQGQSGNEVKMYWKRVAG